MKKIILLFCFAICASLSYGQLKVVTSGDVKVGATAQAPAGALHVTEGNGAGLPGISGSTVMVVHKSVDAGNNAFLSFLGSDAGTVGLNFGDSADEDPGYIQYRNGNNSMVLRTGANANGTSYLLMSSTGNVGLGIGSPAEKLHVGGNILATGTITPSAKALKSNINRFDLGLEQILKISPMSYNYNGKAGIESDRWHVGVIAEEFQKIVPEAVVPYLYEEQDDSGNVISEEEFLSVDEKSITYMLVNSIKEQQSMIEKQAEKIAQMEEIINTIGLSESINDSNVTLTGYDLAELEQNRPNPFNGRTTIDYIVPTNANTAQISIYGVNGQIIKTLEIDHVGQGTLNVSAEDLPSGVYSYQLIVDGRNVQTKKMSLN